MQIEFDIEIECGSSDTYASLLASSDMLRRVTLIKIVVLKELSASIIRETRIGELGTTSAIT
jgi:hypothetical protein